jgi:prophage regulatory protein
LASLTLIGGIPGLRRRGIKYSRQHLTRLEKVGTFPTRVKIGANSVDWITEEIDDWIRDKMRARDEKAA